MRGWAGQYRDVPALGQRWPGVPLRRGSCTKANSRITSNQSNQVRDTPHKPDSRVIVPAHTTAYYRLPRIPLIPGSTFRVPEASSLIFICIKLCRAAGGEVLTSSTKFPKWHFLLLCSSLVHGSEQVISITPLFSTTALQTRARILVQVTIYRRLLIGRDGHLDQSKAYDIYRN